MFSKKEILAQLADFAPRGGIVLAHTSLRAVGEIEGRGEGFLEALIEYFTANGGILCIPTHTWNRGNQTPTLDMNSNVTCIGTLPNIAAAHPYAHRSCHATHSMAVFDGTPAGASGRAEDFISCELELPEPLTPTSPSGCYGRLYDLGGKVMLIGVKHNRNTYLHSVEERMDIPNRLTEKPRSLTIKLKSGEIIRREMHTHSAVGIGDVSENYVKYEPAFRHYGAIADGKLGNADVQLCDARIMTETMLLIRGRSGDRELCADKSPLDERLYI